MVLQNMTHPEGKEALTDSASVPFATLRNASILFRDRDIKFRPCKRHSGSQFSECLLTLKCVGFRLSISFPIPSDTKKDEPKSLPPREVIFSAGGGTPNSSSGRKYKAKTTRSYPEPHALYCCIRQLAYHPENLLQTYAIRL